MKRTRMSVAFLALTGVAALLMAQADNLSAQGKAKTSADKVKARISATRPDVAGKQVVTITLNIEKPWHIYANPVRNDTVAEAKTVVEITGKVKPRSVKVDYPPGIAHTDEILKETYRVYEDQVTIRAQVQRAAGDTGPLQVSIRVNACKKNVCLAPGQITLNVP
jgi:DsbC/DsbD-like thiol-disulfide interchange protein